MWVYLFATLDPQHVLIEELEIGLLAVTCPWNTQESDHTEKVAKKRAGLVMSPEERAENHYNDEVAMVERFIQDLGNTGMLTGLKVIHAMHFVRNFVIPELEGSECTLKRRNVSVIVEVEHAPNVYSFWIEAED
ncbi:hypothetical protein Ddye_029952 [Dipteronia dyeriana]|uniref:Uncharacterized protein n=1 Tax=Dipteronia dyeriana TaxID=168575 RepID=A0AAD9WM70_9ROSI|nr:hypothetical protein Ddye_029952 [Dipteronia dyeriana]